MRLPRSFYTREDVVGVARDLLGKVLVTHIDGLRTAGVITETEAYAGTSDRASHAFAGKRTARNEPMYASGGIAYVYLCYGIHHLFNVVTHREGVPHAVLVRAVRIVEGETHARARRAPAAPTTKGPGTVSRALGITTMHSGLSLLGDTIWIEDRGLHVPADTIIAGPRVGVDYAGADAALPYRFRATPSRP
jgi:DNA-3-methyladenine glycosylase